MAVELTSIATQTVAPNQNVLFTETPIGCNKGYVLHREGSGTVKLRGITNQCYAIYKVAFNGNIAVPTDETPEAISVAIAVDGEPLQSTTMTITSLVVDRFFNVSAEVFVKVPRCCCTTVSVKNISDIPVNVANANLIIERVA